MSLRWFRVLNLSCQFRGFIKAWVLGKLTGCEVYYVHSVYNRRESFDSTEIQFMFYLAMLKMINETPAVFQGYL